MFFESLKREEKKIINKGEKTEDSTDSGGKMRAFSRGSLSLSLSLRLSLKSKPKQTTQNISDSFDLLALSSVSSSPDAKVWIFLLFPLMGISRFGVSRAEEWFWGRIFGGFYWNLGWLREMGFISRKIYPACESMCVCCPALRPSSRRPVKRYKKLLAEIFPKTNVRFFLWFLLLTLFPVVFTHWLMSL